MIPWRWRKSKEIGPIRLRISKTRDHDAHLSASTRIGPFTVSSTGRVNFSLWGFTVPIWRWRRRDL